MFLLNVTNKKQVGTFCFNDKVGPNVYVSGYNMACALIINVTGAIRLSGLHQKHQKIAKVGGE